MMLDWLGSHQATPVTEDSQIPDAPETPAPIFAYRALKGILFGSPDYDAEEEDNKENIAPSFPDPKAKGGSLRLQVARRDVKVDSSPLQPKSTQESPNGRARERQHLVSPSLRKPRELSPTKSILRTPGIPTPRRQNVNVTFKDVRASVSPIAVTTKLLAAQNEAKITGHSRETIRKTKKQTGIAPLEHAKAAGEVQVHSPYDLSSVDAYLKSTEREMKKLVRYSQKLKEYARVSQQENTALRKERDDLRREVEELRKAKIEAKGTLNEHAEKDDSDFRVVGTRRGADNAGGKSSRGAVPEAEQPYKIHAVQAAHLPDRGASVGHVKFPEPTAQLGKQQLCQKEAGDILMQDRRQKVVSKKQAATTAQLAPDRLAAAKERLRVKSEERRRALSAAVG